MTAPYASRAEAMTLDEVAVALRVTRETVEKHYDGPRFKIGRETRVAAAHLQAWMDARAGLTDAMPDPSDDADPQPKGPRLVEAG